MKTNMSGWVLSDFTAYKTAYARYGGSVCSHPDVITFLSQRVPGPEFYIYPLRGDVISATFAADKRIYIDAKSYPVLFDDIILPHNKNRKKIILPFHTKQLSPYHDGDFYNCIYWRGLKRKTCIVKDDFSTQTHRKRRGEVKRFIKHQGECRSVDDFSDEALCDIYISLFKKRWGESIRCYTREALLEVFGELRHLIFGYVLLINGQPCAYDLVFKAECPAWIFFDCINGGYDPDYAELSVGSVLMYMNIQLARDLCQGKQVKMAFSLGMDNPRWHYKKQWCNTFTLGRSVTF